MSITIKVDRSATVHRHSRRIEFEGAEPQEHHAYSHRGKLFIPTVAVATWNHGEQPETITVAGQLVKKDGTPSEVRVDFQYATPANSYWGRNESWGWPDAPEWLLKLFGIDLPDTTDKTGLQALTDVLQEFGGQK